MKLNTVSKIYKITVNKAEERLFLLSASLYAMISGALIGAATNLLTSVLFQRSVSNINLIYTAISYLFVSSFCFACISLVLEQLHDMVGEGDKITKRMRLLEKIKGKKIILWSSIIGGLESVIIGIVFLYCGTR